MPTMNDTNTVFRSPEGRRQLLSLYERWVEALPVAFERVAIQTRIGPTNVLVGGPPDAPPLVVHQGGNFINPATLIWFGGLMSRFRVYAPDLPGGPGYSKPRHLDGRKGEFCAWAQDVLDALDLAAVPHAGVSMGGGIILELAAKAPERIERMALIVPAGINRPAMLPLLGQLALPMLRFQLNPSRANLIASTTPLHTDPVSELTLETYQAVFQHLRLTRRMPGPIPDGALTDCQCPALVIGAEKDPLFPGERLLARASQLLPHADTRLLPESRHFPSDRDLNTIARWLDDFMG